MGTRRLGHFAADVAEPGSDVVTAMDRVDGVDDPEPGQTVSQRVRQRLQTPQVAGEASGSGTRGELHGVKGQSQHRMGGKGEVAMKQQLPLGMESCLHIGYPGHVVDDGPKGAADLRLVAGRQVLVAKQQQLMVVEKPPQLAG